MELLMEEETKGGLPTNSRNSLTTLKVDEVKKSITN